MPRRRSVRGLTSAEELFVKEYIIDDNATRAYRAVHPDCTYVAARQQGSKWKAKPYIKIEIAAARDAQQRRTLIRADAAIREAGRLAFSDPLYLFGVDGVTPRNIRDIPADTRRAIASVKVLREHTERVTRRNGQTETEVTTTYKTIEYKLWPKPRGLDKVFRHLGLETEITPLDALLSALPPALADQVRAALAGGS